MNNQKKLRLIKAAMIKLFSMLLLLAALTGSGRLPAGLTAFAEPSFEIIDKVEFTAPNVPILTALCGGSTSIDYLLAGASTGAVDIEFHIDGCELRKELPDKDGNMTYRTIRESNYAENKWGKPAKYQETFDDGKYMLFIELQGTGSRIYVPTKASGRMNKNTAEIVGQNIGNSAPFWMKYYFTIVHNGSPTAHPISDETQHWYGTCSNCNMKFRLGMHNFKLIVDKPATSSEDGSQHQECSVCGYKKASVLIPRHIHTYAGGTGYYPEQSDADYHWRFCSTCREQVKDKHTYDIGIVTKQPTTLEEGEKVYTCTACRRKKTEKVPKLGDPVATTLHEAGTVLIADNTVFAVKVKADSVEYKFPVGASAVVNIPNTIIIDGVEYNVTAVADGAFKNNKTVTTVVIGSNVTEIGEKAFYNCKALRKVIIPAKVKKIGAGAFGNCKKLKNITIKTTKLTAKKVGAGAFKGTNAKATVKVPAKKLKAYQKLLKSKGLSKKAKIKK